MADINELLIAIEAEVAATGIPLDARTDWDGSNHYEIQTASSDGYWWLICSEVFAQRSGDPSATEAGKRLGAVLDFAVSSRVNVPRLCAAVREYDEFLSRIDGKAINSAPIRLLRGRVRAILAGEESGGDPLDKFDDFSAEEFDEDSQDRRGDA